MKRSRERPSTQPLKRQSDFLRAQTNRFSVKQICTMCAFLLRRLKNVNIVRLHCLNYNLLKILFSLHDYI